MSSQHVELEGLLLGLNYINNHWITLMEKRDRMLEASSVVQSDRMTLKIQGDCSTVIYQLSGKAAPRKLEAPMNEARRLLSQILSRDNSIELRYSLVPRHENCVCDRLCSNLMKVVASKAWNKCIDDIEEVCRNHNADPSRKSHSSVLVRGILNSHLDPSSSVIKYSLRLPLYGKLAGIAMNFDDYDALIHIGEQLERELQRWFAQEGTAKAVKSRSVEYQVKGWRGLGNRKKVTFLEHKHRMLLRCDDEMDHGHSELSCDELRSLCCSEEEWDQSTPQQWKDVLNAWFRETISHGGNDASPLWVRNGTSNQNHRNQGIQDKTKALYRIYASSIVE
jgi:hypothetical protein